jgi:hypothetical protein
LNGVFHSKTPIAPALAWIALWNTEFNQQNTVVLRGLRMDEGAGYGIACFPSAAVSGRVASLFMSDLHINVGILGGCFIRNIDTVWIEHTGFYLTKQPLEAIHLQAINSAVLSDVRCEAAADRIVAESNVKALHVSDSKYNRLISDAETTLVTQGGVDAFLVRADGAIPPQSLVIQSPTTDRRVIIAPEAAPPYTILGVALDATSSPGDYLRVARFPGFAVAMRSDGAGPINRGDTVGPSPILPGCVRVVAPGAHIGRSLTTVAADTAARPQVVFSPV